MNILALKHITNTFIVILGQISRNKIAESNGLHNFKVINTYCWTAIQKGFANLNPHQQCGSVFLPVLTDADHNYEKNKISTSLVSENLSSIFSLIWISLITGIIKHLISFESFLLFPFLISCEYFLLIFPV